MKKYLLFGDKLTSKIWQLYQYEFLNDNTIDEFITHVSEMFILDEEEIDNIKLWFENREFYK